MLRVVFRNEGRLFSEARVILAGGTALARCYLHHRVSYDLDFFVSTRFDPIHLQGWLLQVGLSLRNVEMLSEPGFSSQLHGVVEVEGEPLRISFLEDPYPGWFPMVQRGEIRTESLEGLYHRKLRALVGSGKGKPSLTGQVDQQGARWTARDLVDLYVLSRDYIPLPRFVRQLNEEGIGIPETLLLRGFRKIPWRELLDEFELLELTGRYRALKWFDVKRYFDQVLSWEE